MSHVTPDMIESYLSDYGWQFVATGEMSWKTGWEGEHAVYPMKVYMTKTCVGFEVNPLLPFQLPASGRAEFLQQLLELNQEMQLAKLAVTGDTPVLSCQVLRAGFDFHLLSQILGILGYYADAVTEEIVDRMDLHGQKARPPLPS